MILPANCRRVGLLALSLWASWACGCALFQSPSADDGLQGTRLGDLWSQRHANAQNPDIPVRRLARLETAVITRPATDQRIRRLVWEGLDESGVMAPEERQQLNSNGFRVGVAGSSLPWVISSLMAESAEDGRAGELPTQGNSQNTPTTGAIPLALLEGSESQFFLGDQRRGHTIPEGELGDLSQEDASSDLRCALQMRVEEADGSWIRLSILPVLYSGREALRFSVQNGNEQLPIRQKVHPLYEQKFSVRLHVGEAAVIGHLPGEQWTPGELFFREDNALGKAAEHLVIIRPVRIEEIEGRNQMVVEVERR